MDLETYVIREVDDMGLPLNFRQRNFLETLFLEQYSQGNELAHSVMDKAIFASQAEPYLTKCVKNFSDSTENLEKISVGDWAGIINVKGLLSQITDRFFSKNVNYTPREKLALYDLVAHENPIQERCLVLVQDGLHDALEEWCRNRMMGLADGELSKEYPNEGSSRPKTRKPEPMVERRAGDPLG